MKLAYDIGGYDGSDTEHYLSLGYKVVCVEASPSLAENIRNKLAKPIAEGRLKVLQVAVGNDEGEVTFHESPNPLWNSLSAYMAGRAGAVKKVKVQLRKLADVIAENGPADFVKIDVEGGDLNCLMSLAKGPVPEFVSCELDQVSGSTMIFSLINMGYTKFNLVDQNNYQHVRIPPAGTFAHVKWSARQWMRLALRKTPIHGMLRKLKDSRTTANSSASHGAGPTPMEHKGTWISGSELMAMYIDMSNSGMLGSSWYDVHCSR